MSYNFNNIYFLTKFHNVKNIIGHYKILTIFPCPNPSQNTTDTQKKAAEAVGSATLSEMCHAHSTNTMQMVLSFKLFVKLKFQYFRSA